MSLAAEDIQYLKEHAAEWLPELLEKDPALRRFVVKLTRDLYADRQRTDDRFDCMLEELQRDREEQASKWDEQKAEGRRRWDEQARKWRESREAFDKVHEEIMAQAAQVDRSIGALGAR